MIASAASLQKPDASNRPRKASQTSSHPASFVGSSLMSPQPQPDATARHLADRLLNLTLIGGEPAMHVLAIVRGNVEMHVLRDLRRGAPRAPTPPPVSAWRSWPAGPAGRIISPGWTSAGKPPLPSKLPIEGTCNEPTSKAGSSPASQEKRPPPLAARAASAGAAAAPPAPAAAPPAPRAAAADDNAAAAVVSAVAAPVRAAPPAASVAPPARRRTRRRSAE